jgi:hypothetical protein
MTSLIAAIDHLAELIADHLKIPRCDELSMPLDLRDALAEVRRLASPAPDNDDDNGNSEETIDRLEDELAEATDLADDRGRCLDLLRDRLAEAAGLPAWQWRRLPPDIAELLE